MVIYLILPNWDFITSDEATEEYDLLKWFEGDPDYLELGDDYKCYFTGFHPDYTYEGEPVILTTSESQEEIDYIKGFMENLMNWCKVDVEGFRAATGAKIAYRGGRSHSEGLRNFRDLLVCDPVPSRKGLATFPGSKIAIKTKIQ